MDEEIAEPTELETNVLGEAPPTDDAEIEVQPETVTGDVVSEPEPEQAQQTAPVMVEAHCACEDSITTVPLLQIASNGIGWVADSHCMICGQPVFQKIVKS